MSENNNCFKKLSPDHQQLWLNIHQNAKTINLFWKLDYDRFMCINCFKYLGDDMPDGYSHAGGYCDSFMFYAMFCDVCTKELNLETDNGLISASIICPICWYFQIKNSKEECSKDIYTPPIGLNQWQLVDISRIHQSYGSICDGSEDGSEDGHEDE